MKIKHLKVYEEILKNNNSTMTAEDIAKIAGVKPQIVYSCVKGLRTKKVKIHLRRGLKNKKGSWELNEFIKKYTQIITN